MNATSDIKNHEIDTNSNMEKETEDKKMNNTHK